MREDMAKILVERPRHGGGVKYPRNAGREPVEDRPRHEAIKSRFLRRCKQLNENLAPLRRFLQRRVGQPWDSVYSEICERINRDSAVQLHIWQHLMWEVARDPVQIEKMFARPLLWRMTRFYVDPNTKRLRAKQPVRRARRVPEPFLITVDCQSFKQLNSIWYAIELAPLACDEAFVWDAILSRADDGKPRLVDRTELINCYGRAVYAVRKRQLNTKEIRRLEKKREQ